VGRVGDQADHRRHDDHRATDEAGLLHVPGDAQADHRGEHAPSVRGTDHGIWRRMRLVPWTVQIPPDEQDRELAHRLVETEASGILAWLVRGCLAWQRLSLGHANAIEAATNAYRADEDTLGRWIEDRCEVGESLWWTTDGLYKSYQAWCSEEGIEKPWTRRIWQARMCERPGIEPHRTTIARGLKRRPTTRKRAAEDDA
jgi:putative DNA primase/helicase